MVPLFPSLGRTNFRWHKGDIFWRVDWWRVTLALPGRGRRTEGTDFDRLTNDPMVGSDRMARGPGPKSKFLGRVGEISCTVVPTNRPWELDIDAIVLSVGTVLGGLGVAVRTQFPGAAWKSIPYSMITPDRPGLLELRESARTGSGLRLAVLATVHEGGMPSGVEGEPTLGAVGVATASALRTAADAQVTAIGVPLLSTGVLGFPHREVAEVAIPAARRALDGLSGSSLRLLVFFGSDEESALAIRTAWHQVPVNHPGETKIAATSPAQTRQVPESPAYSTVELAGGVSSDLVDPNVGIPLIRDQLGVAPYVSMLATVIADRKTPLPLSVGIFGEWGSGKSYFMGLLRGQVDQLACSKNPSYCEEVVQIGFNAWHYSDSNLWASLGDEIFRQLAGSGPNAEERREQIRTELGERLAEREELEAATRRAQEAAAVLQADVDAATAAKRTSARDLVKALRESGQLGALWRRLGVHDEIEQGTLLAEELHGALADADVLRRSSQDRRGKLALATAAAVLLAATFAAVLLPIAKEWLAGIGVLFTSIAGAGIAAMCRARSGLRALRALAEELRASLDRSARHHVAPKVAETLDALRKAETDQCIAEAQLGEVLSRVAELGRRLTELTPGNRLYAFLADRAHGGSYTRGLGLISTMRKDFQQLVELMADWRAHPDSGGAPRKPLDRIVLYIDDLDRCGPRQVVEVLEAVHLLLALELFVVVVGVDPRWLARSLCSHYDNILEGSSTGDGTWRVTPEDYLEKIINIPMVLPDMSSGSMNQLLRSMLEDNAAVPGATPNSPRDDRAVEPQLQSRRPAPDPPTISVEPGSEVDSLQRTGKAGETPRPLTDPEITLLATLDPLVGTPREAKRLFNLYRMLRATRDLSDASRFLGDDERPGEYQAVIVLLGLLTAHARLLGEALHTPPDPASAIRGGLMHRSPSTSWDEFVANFEPQRSSQGWVNKIIGPVPEDEARHWIRTHRSLVVISTAITLVDVSCFQLWVPRICRFSYVLLPPGDGSPTALGMPTMS